MSPQEAGSSRSRRILSIWLPALAIDRWRVMADEHSRVLDRGPLVLIADTAHGPRIEAGNRAAAEAGATAIIQPGGSMRDSEVIDAANEAGLAMVFTGMRHFRH